MQKFDFRFLSFPLFWKREGKWKEKLSFWSEGRIIFKLKLESRCCSFIWLFWFSYNHTFGTRNTVGINDVINFAILPRGNANWRRSRGIRRIVLKKCIFEYYLYIWFHSCIPMSKLKRSYYLQFPRIELVSFLINSYCNETAKNTIIEHSVNIYRLKERYLKYFRGNRPIGQKKNRYRVTRSLVGAYPERGQHAFFHNDAIFYGHVDRKTP